MSRRPPNTRTILIYLVILLVIVALVAGVLGGAGWVRVLRVMLIYGGVFLVTIFILRRARRRS